jgi:hypothetical protein
MRCWTRLETKTDQETKRSDVAEPEKLETFCGYEIGTKPLFWEMHAIREKKVQSARHAI